MIKSAKHWPGSTVSDRPGDYFAGAVYYIFGGIDGAGCKGISMDLVIRDARPEDAGGIIAVFNPIIEAGLYTVFDTPFSEEAERRYIDQLPPRGIFHVAARTADGSIVGFQSMEPFATYTHAFDHVGVLGTYVDLACRRQGVATSLFRATFEAAQGKGYEKVLTYIRADNPSAIATYLKQGFRIVGTAFRQAKIRENYIDEVIVERLLTAVHSLHDYSLSAQTESAACAR